jgi:hypothetical protein
MMTTLRVYEAVDELVAELHHAAATLHDRDSQRLHRPAVGRT